MTVAGPAAESAEQTATVSSPPPAKRNKIKTGEGRLALMLVAPTIVLLVLVVGYPVSQGDLPVVPVRPRPRPVDRLLQQCLALGRPDQLQALAAAAVPDRPAAAPASARPAPWARSSGPRSGHHLLHRRHGDHRDRHRHVLRADDEPGLQGPRPGPCRDPGAVGDPDRRHLQAVDRDLRPAGHPEQGARHCTTQWTSSQWPARTAIVIADVWKTTPFIALLILAGLQGISARPLRIGPGRRRQRLAAVHPDHAAAGQARAGRRGHLPDPGRAADVRPAVRSSPAAPTAPPPCRSWWSSS